MVHRQSRIVRLADPDGDVAQYKVVHAFAQTLQIVRLNILRDDVAAGADNR